MVKIIKYLQAPTQQLTSFQMASQLLAPKNPPETTTQANASTSSNFVKSSSSLKPFTYFANVDKTSGTAVEIIKGCIITLASKLSVVEEANGRVWSVKVTSDALNTSKRDSHSLPYHKSICLALL